MTTADFDAKLDKVAPKRTAGALPSTRTFSMVADALASEDIDQVKGELQHTRAHYQSLEYMLNHDEQIAKTIIESFSDPECPVPETVEDAVRLTTRVFASAVLDAAYDNAHAIGFFVQVLGRDVQQALQSLYSELDFSDPEREVSDEAIAAFIAGDDED